MALRQQHQWLWCFAGMLVVSSGFGPSVQDARQVCRRLVFCTAHDGCVKGSFERVVPAAAAEMQCLPLVGVLAHLKAGCGVMQVSRVDACMCNPSSGIAAAVVVVLRWHAC
jgi:hypothetical protein